jgi:putative flavoprotein involved in K+ transport
MSRRRHHRHPADMVIDCVVVGAGPAGLAASAALRGRGVEHVVLERGRVGESWRTQRWDSFRLNTPAG